MIAVQRDILIAREAELTLRISELQGQLVGQQAQFGHQIERLTDDCSGFFTFIAALHNLHTPGE